MAIRKWYSASPLWHFHRRAFPGEIETSRRFYHAVDPDLLELCRLLHREGIHTTPSCQGHFHSRSHFEEVWEELRREQRLIQTVGLPVTDSESGREFLFRASKFELPWATFDEFHQQASSRQREGFLGILLPRDRHALVSKLHRHPFRSRRAFIAFDGGLSCLLGGSLFYATVLANDPEECSRSWRAITEHVKSLLDCESSHAPRFRQGDAEEPSSISAIEQREQCS